MSDEQDDVEEVVRMAKLKTTRAFDERVLADAAVSHRASPRALRIAAGIVVAIALGGALTAAVVGWVHRDRAPANDGSNDASTPCASAPLANEPLPPAVQAERAPEPPVAHTDDHASAIPPPATVDDEVIEEPEPTVMGMGWPRNVDARATVHEAKIIARIRLTGLVKHAKGGLYDLPHGTIEEIYKGDAALVGRAVTIHPKRTETRNSFLCWRSDGAPSVASGKGIFVIPLEVTNVGLPEKGDVHLRVALGDLFAGTQVKPDLPVRVATRIEDEIVTMLRDDLAASLAAPEPDTRISSISALRNWSGESIEHDVSELWHDETTAKALLAAGRDENPTVRWTVAWMVNPAAGVAGRELLEDLLFDPDTLVRQPAASQLKQIGSSKILDTIESVRDWKWDESLSGALSTSADYAQDHSAATLKQLKEHAQAEIRAGIAWGLGNHGSSKETSDALLAALSDPDFEVRRGAAHSLGKVGGDGVADRLDGIANTEDPRVRVMTAWSQVSLGDKRGYAHLSRLVFDDDARAATQACEALGRIAKKDSVELLLSAAEDPRPVVRGAAVTALSQRARKSDAPHRAAVEELLANLVKDDDEYVRAASRAALQQRLAKPAKVARSADDEKIIGQLGYIVAEDPDDE